MSFSRDIDEICNPYAPSFIREEEITILNECGSSRGNTHMGVDLDDQAITKDLVTRMVSPRYHNTGCVLV